MRKSRLLASAIFMIAIIASASSLFAQQGGGRGWGMGPEMMGPGWARGMMGEEWGMGRGWGRGMMGMGCPMIAFGDDGETTTFVEGRTAFLKAELKITDAQQQAWGRLHKGTEEQSGNHEIHAPTDANGIRR
jgi:hypothetical protein